MKKILIIEDQPSLRNSIVAIFQHEGFEVAEAGNGWVGVELAHQVHPDLVVSDVSMPVMDGYGVLEHLRQDPATATIPFVFLTARNDRQNMRRGMELGADDFLTKPFTVPELLATVHTQLEKREKLEELSEQKLDHLRDSLILSLPHELRTPLTGILGFAEILMSGSDSAAPDQVKMMAQHIYNGATRLNRLIQNYLLYSQLEILHLDIERMESMTTNGTSRARAIIECQALDTARQARREADLKLEVADEQTVQIGENYLQKIVEELVDNAFKFSQPGTPVYVAAGVNADSYTLRVSDRGRGMSSEQIAEIGAGMQFERQLHEQQGSGLGLIIARRLTELHGGELAVESAYGEWTTVTMNFRRGA